MKKRFLLLFLSGMMAIGNILSAQNITDSEKKRMSFALLETIEKLETLSSLSDADQANEYISLFSDSDVMVFNDLIGVSDVEMMPLGEYVSCLRRMKNVVVRFSNVERSRPYIDAGSLCVKVSFDKTISYIDQRGVHYSTDDVYGRPYRITAVFSYDDFDGSCRIESFNGCLNGVSTLSSEHLVLKKKRWHEDLKFRKAEVPVRKGFYDMDECAELDFDKAGFGLLPAGAAAEDWYCMQNMPWDWDPDKSLSAEAGADGFLNLHTKNRHMRLKAYNSTAPAGAYHMEGELDGRISVGNETGVEFRYMFNLGNQINIGALVSAGVSYSYIDVSLKDFRYSYDYTTSAKRAYDFNVFGQKFHTVDAVVSLGTAMEYAFARRWSLDFAFGCKAYYNIYAGAGDVYCMYEVNHTGKGTDYIKGHFKKETVVNAVDFKSCIRTLPLSLIAKLGLDVSISSSSLLTFGLGFEQGLSDYYQSELIPFKSYKYPVMYSSKSGSDEARYSLSNSFNLVRRAIWVDLGYVFRF